MWFLLSFRQNKYQFAQKIFQIIFPHIMSGDEQKFAPFTLPDISKVDPTIITKFSKKADIPAWRTVHKGLNLEGICKNKQDKCVAYGKKVWVGLGYGKFFMSMEVYQAKCPMCQKPTKGNKKIGIHSCQLTGNGMKVKTKKDADETDDQAQNPTQNTDTATVAQARAQQENDQEVQEQFQKIICDSKDGFLKMNGVNGPFVQWRYMTLEIKKLQKKSSD